MVWTPLTAGISLILATSSTHLPSPNTSPLICFCQSINPYRFFWRCLKTYSCYFPQLQVLLRTCWTDWACSARAVLQPLCSFLLLPWPKHTRDSACQSSTPEAIASFLTPLCPLLRDALTRIFLLWTPSALKSPHGCERNRETKYSLITSCNFP